MSELSELVGDWFHAIVINQRGHSVQLQFHSGATLTFLCIPELTLNGRRIRKADPDYWNELVEMTTLKVSKVLNSADPTLEFGKGACLRFCVKRDPSECPGGEIAIFDPADKAGLLIWEAEG